MPAGPGESLLITCFADVHYHFNDPAERPAHHRFAKGSYVYLYYNPASRHTKLEIANHAGTPEQDAFHGSLNVAIVRHSYLHPTLFSVLVNSSAVPDQSTWHLADDQRYLYKLHAVDMYMWTEKDASNVLNQLKSVLSPDRLDIKEAPGTSSPHSEHRDSMSPVVQQLERTAIGSQFPPRNASTTSAQSFAGPPTQAFPGPPTSAGAAAPTTTSGYNPAAPAAPEPVTYREPTPPPPDDGTGTGLKGPTPFNASSATPYSGQQPGQQPSYFSGPPQPHLQQRAPSFGPMAQSTIAQSPSHAGSPGSYSNLPPTPTAPPAYSAGIPPQSHHPPSAPISGYSNYSYDPGQGQGQTAANIDGQSPYNIHQVAYRVSEAEAQAHGHGHGKPKRQSSASANPGKASAKVQEGVDKVEGTVGRFFKNFDRLI